MICDVLHALLSSNEDGDRRPEYSPIIPVSVKVNPLLSPISGTALMPDA